MVANIKKDVSEVEAFKKLMEIGFQKATSRMMKTGDWFVGFVSEQLQNYPPKALINEQ